MTQAQLVLDLTNDAVVIAFTGASVFIVTYTVMARWWKHMVGTTLVVVDAGLLLTLAPSVLHRFFGLDIGASLTFSWYFFCSITLVAAGIWWRALVMIRANWSTRARNAGGLRRAAASLRRLLAVRFRNQEEET